MINRLAIIGAGLIGGSLALALKQAKQVKDVVAYDHNELARQQALQLGIADHVSDSIADAVAGAEIVVLAVPMGAMCQTLKILAPYITENMVITDVGSAKAQVVDVAKTALGNKFSYFVPGHPIAGTEKNGPAAAFAELYQQHRVILTPVAETAPYALNKVREMWQNVGADVFEMTVEQHDEVLAATSHLPHLLAFNLVALLAQGEDADEVLRYAAGGFRDFSRIASSNPLMWRDICLGNRDAILTLLQQFQRDLALVEHAIEQEDGDYLMTVFQRAKLARDSRFAEPGLIDNSEV